MCAELYLDEHGILRYRPKPPPVQAANTVAVTGSSASGSSLLPQPSGSAIGNDVEMRDATVAVGGTVPMDVDEDAVRYMNDPQAVDDQILTEARIEAQMDVLQT